MKFSDFTKALVEECGCQCAGDALKCKCSDTCACRIKVPSAQDVIHKEMEQDLEENYNLLKRVKADMDKIETIAGSYRKNGFIANQFKKIGLGDYNDEVAIIETYLDDVIAAFEAELLYALENDINESEGDFVKDIVKLKNANKNKWYTFVGEIQGKRVRLKGYGTWLQIFKVDGVDYGNGTEISVKAFKELLISPF